jgi:hypothetical protein
MAVLSDTDIAGYAYNAGFRGDDLAKAVAIALAESGGDPSAVSPQNSNGTYDYGLFQINSSHTDSGLFDPLSGNTPFQTGVLAGTAIGLGNSEGWSDPQKNADYAFQLYQGRGGNFTDWSTYNNGSYQQFMSRGQTAAANPNTSVQGGASSSNSPAAGLSGAVDAVVSIAGDLFKAAAWTANPKNWGRVTIVMVGGAMVIGALIVVSKPVIEPAAKTAAKVAAVAA